VPQFPAKSLQNLCDADNLCITSVNFPFFPSGLSREKQERSCCHSACLADSRVVSLVKQRETIKKYFASAPGVFEERVNDRGVFSPYRQQSSKICTKCQQFLSLSVDKHNECSGREFKITLKRR